MLIRIGRLMNWFRAGSSGMGGGDKDFQDGGTFQFQDGAPYEFQG